MTYYLKKYIYKFFEWENQTSVMAWAKRSPTSNPRGRKVQLHSSGNPKNQEVTNQICFFLINWWHNPLHFFPFCANVGIKDEFLPQCPLKFYILTYFPWSCKTSQTQYLCFERKIDFQHWYEVHRLQFMYFHSSHVMTVHWRPMWPTNVWNEATKKRGVELGFL